MTVLAWLLRDARAQSGANVARLFHGLLALLLLVAWLSIAPQLHALIGSRGLLPVAPWLDELAAAREPGALGALALFHRAPTLLWLGASDRALSLLAAAGIGFALAALVVPRRARACFAISIPLYLSLAVAGRTFLSFQWDNLLLECLLLGALLPRDRPGRVAHVLLRLLLFKLYFESGIAKWCSPLGDWRDGSAMTFYYQTAPLPTSLARWFHLLPAAWHHVESWATLALELVAPLLVFGPRPTRLLALGSFTGFQIVNAATGNYGFFVHLALALHLFLLDERDLAWLRARLRMRAPEARVERPAHRASGIVALALWSSLSLVSALLSFAGDALPRQLVPALARIDEAAGPLRLVSTYHLFAAITRTRDEPQIETRSDGKWSERDLRWKAGDPSRAPRFVAPHQPRLDFQLWFYGLSYRRGAPEWVLNLLDRVCRDPASVQPLFRDPLPVAPAAARIGFFAYRYATDEERRQTGDFWVRTRLGSTREVPCGAASE